MVVPSPTGQLMGRRILPFKKCYKNQVVNGIIPPPPLVWQPFFPNKPQFTVTINDIKILINGKNANVGGLIDLFATKMGIRKK
jgi:hypothetical protein